MAEFLLHELKTFNLIFITKLPGLLRPFSFNYHHLLKSIGLFVIWMLPKSGLPDLVGNYSHGLFAKHEYEFQIVPQVDH
jgi:hypothetical protein